MKLRKGEPRHQQISSWLRKQIRSGALSPDDQLPSESRLGSQFGVSRITVRRALHTLESEGLIYRKQGLGSFVQSRPVRQSLLVLTDFVEDMAAAGLVASSRTLRLESEPAPALVAEALGVEAGKPVVCLERVRLGDGQAVAFDRTWLPMLYGHLLEDHDLGEQTIYSILEEEFDIPIVSGTYRIEAVNAKPDVAGVLGIPRGRALLLIERLSRTIGGKSVYYQRRYYRSDLVAYELELERDRGRTNVEAVKATLSDQHATRKMTRRKV